MASKSDIQIASLAAGFTIGFGFLTVWEAIKQTRLNRSPLRSAYIYMVWGEIVANLCIGILGWLFLQGVISDSVTILFFFLFFWVFEIQLLMQIIINRISVIAERQDTIRLLKWGTAGLITAINIAVFCIWIPAHMNPPVNDTYVKINEYWDRTSKVLILLVDAGLNYYFLRTVKLRLVKYHGLVKYAPLVSFNAKLMVLSILMDAMLIGLMSLPNQVVYIQFHPVTYMVKLNIELSMANLITKLAYSGRNDDFYARSLGFTANGERHVEDQGIADDSRSTKNHGLKRFPSNTDTDTEGQAGETPRPTRKEGGIRKRTEVGITIEHADPSLNRTNTLGRGPRGPSEVDDEIPLAYHAGPPSGRA